MNSGFYKPLRAVWDVSMIPTLHDDSIGTKTCQYLLTVLTTHFHTEAKISRDVELVSLPYVANRIIPAPYE